MIIPIAKLLVTPNKVSFYEKFQKTYFEGNYDLINTPFKLILCIVIRKLIFREAIFKSRSRQMETNF